MPRSRSLYSCVRSSYLWAIGLVFASIQAASAGVLYEQPALWNGNGSGVGFGWTSQSDAGVNGFRTFDNFSLGAAATINQASWVGIYLNSADLTEGAPNTSDWVIRFYSDNAGAPLAVLSTTVLPTAQVTRQAVGTGLFGNNTVTIYEFTAFLNSFDADAGTTYWFSPLSRATNFSPLFSWIEGTGGNGTSFQTAFAGGVVTNSFVREGDRAFSLSSVPEPSTWYLVGAALAGIAFVRRRFPNADRDADSPGLQFS